MSKEAEKLVQAKKRKEGENLFCDAINLWGDNREAQYGLAQCYLEQGKSSDAIEQYRLCVYRKTDNGIEVVGFPHQPFELALLLSKAGLSDEASFVYNTALLHLNYRDDKQYLKVLLPEFGPKPGQRAYTPVDLQAMAHVAIAQTINDEPKAWEHLKEAVRIYPKSGTAQFYFAEVLRSKVPEEARAVYTKAKQLDPKGVGQAADRAMRTGNLWRLGDPIPTTP